MLGHLMMFGERTFPPRYWGLRYFGLAIPANNGVIVPPALRSVIVPAAGDPGSVSAASRSVTVASVIRSVTVPSAVRSVVAIEDDHEAEA